MPSCECLIFYSPIWNPRARNLYIKNYKVEICRLLGGVDQQSTLRRSMINTFVNCWSIGEGQSTINTERINDWQSTLLSIIDPQWGERVDQQSTLRGSTINTFVIVDSGEADQQSTWRGSMIYTFVGHLNMASQATQDCLDGPPNLWK